MATDSIGETTAVAVARKAFKLKIIGKINLDNVIVDMQATDFMVTAYGSKPCWSMTECRQWQYALKTGKSITIFHYDDVIMTMLASQITSLTVVCSIVYSGVNQRKHQSSASLAFVREIHRGPVNFPHKWPVTRKMFPFDDVIMS